MRANKTLRLLAGVAGILCATTATAQRACTPVLTVTDVRFSQMKPPSLERRWSATVLVNTSHCAANASGYFEMGFARLKENAPDIDFSEEFVWMAPSAKISIDLWADEAVESFWIGKVSACACPQ